MPSRAVHDRHPASPADWRFDRRSVLGMGGGLVALGAIGVARLADESSALSPIRYVVTDHRHGESLVFGETLARQGSMPLEVTEGLTRMWRETLMPLWKEGVGAVAGLTSLEVFGCLSEQARSAGRRSRLIGRHLIEERSRLAAHSVTLPGSMPATSAGGHMLSAQPAQWVAAMAQLVASRSLAQGKTAHVTASPPAAPAHTLVSWIIE